jgi:hypothetical protein
MKRAVVILFLFTYLFSTTEAGQLFKIPVVIAHYKEHKKENRNISITKYLAMHYLHGSPRDKDYNRDMQLPFKTPSDLISSIGSGFTPMVMHYSFERLIFDPLVKNHIVREQFISSSYLSNIWQPPKTC